jgi:hypothetical protein
MEDIRKKLEEMIESTIEELATMEVRYELGAIEDEEYGEDSIYWNFINNALEINRFQTYVPGEGWRTNYYELVMAVGGLWLTVRTDGIIEAGWGQEYIKRKITDEKALEALEVIESLLDEL